MADISKPLNELTKKDAAWYWNDQCESAYQELRKRLLREPGRFSVPIWDKPFVVESDASGIATGAVMCQEGNAGRLVLLEFYSSSLNETQRKF